MCRYTLFVITALLGGVMKELTKRQKEVLDVIQDCIEKQACLQHVWN